MMEFAYLNKIKQLLQAIESDENESMEKAVMMLADGIMNKKSIFIFGASHAGILSEEMYYRAGGLVLINPIFGREMMLDTSPITHTSQMERLEGYGEALMKKVPIREGDILIVHSVSGRNCVSVEIAMEAKKRGAKVIALTNVTYSMAVTSRHSSGKRLFEVCDLVLDNHGEPGDACVSIEGLEQKVSPTSTVVGAAMLNSIAAAVVKELVERGVANPPVFYSANQDGGDELNQKIYNAYKDMIHYEY